MKQLFFCAFGILFFSSYLFAQTPALVKDIVPGVPSGFPQNLTLYDGKLFFSSNGDLWACDGTTSGTQLIKSIGSTNDLTELTVCNGKLFFAGDDGVNGFQPWVSDGTPAGTVMLKNIWPGSISGSTPSFFTVIGTTLFFVADSINGPGLWISDGTTSGTTLVEKFSSGSIRPHNLRSFNGKLYFEADDGISGAELWTSDGTASGTQLVKDINPGAASSSPDNLYAYNGKLYFTATNASGKSSLWASDGTDTGTKVLIDLIYLSKPVSFLGYGSKVYFNAQDPTLGYELWISDGTKANTKILKDICSGSCSGSPLEFAEFRGKIYFTANDTAHGPELWATDGTDTGTHLIKDILSGHNGSFPTTLTKYNGRLYFNVFNEGRNLGCYDLSLNKVYIIDSSATTLPLEEAFSLTEYNGSLYFDGVYDNVSIGHELYSITTTPDTTDAVPNNYLNTSTVRVYPNPAGDFIYAEYSQNTHPDIFTIEDMMGRPVIKGEVTQEKQRIDLHELPAGIYFFSAWSGKYRLYTSKIIKQ